MSAKVSKLKVQVRLNDLDSMGHVNNAVYLTYFEMGRVDFFNRFFEGLDPSNAGFVLVHSEVDYRKPIFLDSKVEVVTRITKLGNTSFTFTHDLIDSDDPERNFATGITVGVPVDSEGRKQKIPESFKNLI